MKAINNYIVIEKIKEKPKSEGGFVLTEAQSDDIRYLKGKVISKGDLINSINENDIDWYDKHAGHGIEWNDELYHVINLGEVVIVE